MDKRHPGRANVGQHAREQPTDPCGRAGLTPAPAADGGQALRRQPRELADTLVGIDFVCRDVQTDRRASDPCPRAPNRN
jgi:hypothetical protein